MQGGLSVLVTILPLSLVPTPWRSEGGVAATGACCRRPTPHPRLVTPRCRPIESVFSPAHDATQQRLAVADWATRRRASARSRPINLVTALTPAYDTTQRYAAADWAKNMRTMPGSDILRRISSPLLFNVFVTIVTCSIHVGVRAIPALPSLPHTLSGSALGLLLVFRTNAAYDRFWEARKQWGVVTSETRNMAGLACTFMTPQQALPILSLVAAFPVVFKSYLRGERETRRLKALLATQEAEALDQVINKPQYVLARLRQLSQASNALGVTEKEREVLLKSVGVLGECVSTCERIYNTPIPLAYSRHTSRFLVLYMNTLPLVLVNSLGWILLPVMATLCWALFGILEIGNLIEEPFTAIESPSFARPLLPLTEVCRTIRRDVRAIALYAELARQCGAPTLRKAKTYASIELPDNFRKIREVLGAEKEAEKAKADAKAGKRQAAEKAAAEKVEKAAAEKEAEKAAVAQAAAEAKAAAEEAAAVAVEAEAKAAAAAAVEAKVEAAKAEEAADEPTAGKEERKVADEKKKEAKKADKKAEEKKKEAKKADKKAQKSAEEAAKKLAAAEAKAAADAIAKAEAAAKEAEEAAAAAAAADDKGDTTEAEVIKVEATTAEAHEATGDEHAATDGRSEATPEVTEVEATLPDKKI